MTTIKTFPVNPLEENCYIISDETGEGCIIDCGCLYEEEWINIKTYLCQKGIKLVRYLNTHCHFDHIFGSGYVFHDFGLKIEMHENERDQYLNIEKQLSAFGISSLKHSPLAPISKYLVEGDKITFGNNNLEVIETPGHSAGGLCFYCKEGKCLFTGDTLFQGSIGRTDFEGGNFNQLIECIRGKLLVLPQDTQVYPGHGAATTIGYEIKNNMYL